MPKRSSFSGPIHSPIDADLVVSELRAILERRLAQSLTSERATTDLTAKITAENGPNIDPILLGTLFESHIDPAERHHRGVHYTPCHAIYEYVILPSLVEPWRKQIEPAKTEPDLLQIHAELVNLRILDPACGSGHFLIVAYRALLELEQDIAEKARRDFNVLIEPLVSIRQLFGIDIDPVAVELTKALLFLAEKRERGKHDVVPLDSNVVQGDALFCPWPKADLIVGNPPFQSKNQMQREFGPDYVQRLRKTYPDVPGRADYCVYWFRRAHDELAPNNRAGLVGTNTIRQNYSREGGLDYIVKNGGTILDAVSTMVWPGKAIVHVSIVNWIKGQANGKKKLAWQEGDHINNPWHERWLDTIAASLSPEIDVTNAQALLTNEQSKTCFQGQTHGHEGFLLSPDEVSSMVATFPNHQEVIFPYLIGEDLLANRHGQPARWIIDFSSRQEIEARRYALAFQRLENTVYPDRKAAAEREKRRNQTLIGRANRHHAHFFKHWWLLGYARGELMQKIQKIPRYIVCSRVTKRPIFEFISSRIHPSDALAVFPLADDYSFGILQSSLHWAWFTARCSTLTARFRYTSETVFSSFPWPQTPSENHCRGVAEAARALREVRRKMADEQRMNLRAMYAALEKDGAASLQEAHARLDAAVQIAYGMPARMDPLTFLLDLNQKCATREARREGLTGPGLPRESKLDAFMTADCVEPPNI